MVPFMIYKRVLWKVLQSKLLCLIGILKDFANDNSEPKAESEETDQTYNSDKENTNIFQL